MKLCPPALLPLFLAMSALGSPVPGEEAPPGLDACNVVFTSPSPDASGAVPVGNGEAGASVWIEPGGDLVMYLARPDSFSEISRLLKIGKLRVHFEPSPLTPNTPFRQELKLRQGRLEADMGAMHVEVLSDPERPVLRVLAQNPEPFSTVISEEGWRRERRVITNAQEGQSAWTMCGLSAWMTSSLKPGFELAESADVVPGPEAVPKALAWYHHNKDSVVPFVMKHQGCEDIAGFRDPLTGRTFGAWVEGDGLVREGNSLESNSPARALDLRIACPTTIAPSPEAWTALAQIVAHASPAGSEVRRQSESWWNAFWNRSWILVPGISDPKLPPTTAASVSRGYNLARYVFACQGRGEAPIKFNGGMFNVEPKFSRRKGVESFDADWRPWGECYWWQNTRHMYHPMLPAGDRDLMQPLFSAYEEGAPGGGGPVLPMVRGQGILLPRVHVALRHLLGV